MNDMLVYLSNQMGHDIRKPHALQSVRAPSGPLRRSGVSDVLHE